jgi:cytochrome bd-type quinol oxidase subunit 2
MTHHHTCRRSGKDGLLWRPSQERSNWNYYWWYWIISLLFVLLFVWICAALAASKGYNPVLFGTLGFFFIVTLIIVLVLPRKTTR